MPEWSEWAEDVREWASRLPFMPQRRRARRRIGDLEGHDPRSVWAMRAGDALSIGGTVVVTMLRVGRRPTLAVDAPGDVEVRRA